MGVLVKKVKLIVINPYDSIQSYEHRPMQEAQFFKEKGCDVEVLVLEQKVLGKGIKQNEIEGVPVKHFLSKTPKMNALIARNKVFGRLRFLFYGKCFLGFILWFYKECKMDQDSYIVAHNLEAAFASCVVNLRSKHKIVFVMREFYEGQSTKKIKSVLISKVSRWIQNRSYALVQVIPGQIRETQKKNRKKVYYIPNYPKTLNYADIEHINSDKIRINYIGCVRDKKSLKMLMDAARGVEGIEVGVHGMGEAYGALKELEKDYDNVKVTGYYDYRTETKHLFANSDIIYCAYNIEVPNWRIAYPIKLYESIEVGIPVLLCEGMEPAQMVRENDFGFVFEYNEESLHQMLLNIKENKELLEIKRQNLKKFKGKYVWENVVQKYEEIIEG